MFPHFDSLQPAEERPQTQAVLRIPPQHPERSRRRTSGPHANTGQRPAETNNLPNRGDVPLPKKKNDHHGKKTSEEPNWSRTTNRPTPALTVQAKTRQGGTETGKSRASPNTTNAEQNDGPSPQTSRGSGQDRGGFVKFKWGLSSKRGRGEGTALGRD